MRMRVILLTAVLLLNSGCATIRRHPVVTGLLSVWQQVQLLPS